MRRTQKKTLPAIDPTGTLLCDIVSQVIAVPVTTEELKNLVDAADLLTATTAMFGKQGTTNIAISWACFAAMTLLEWLADSLRSLVGVENPVILLPLSAFGTLGFACDVLLSIPKPEGGTLPYNKRLLQTVHDKIQVLFTPLGTTGDTLAC